MRAEKVVYTLLAASSALAAIVSTRIYPKVLPQDKTLPAITYEHISSVEPGQIDASGQALVQSRIQVSAIAADGGSGSGYAVCKSIIEAARAALLYQHGTIAGVYVASIVRDITGPDEFDPEINAHMQTIDVIVTHFEQ